MSGSFSFLVLGLLLLSCQRGGGGSESNTSGSGDGSSGGAGPGSGTSPGGSGATGTGVDVTDSTAGTDTAADTDGTEDSSSGGGTASCMGPGGWSAPVSVVQDFGRLAIGNQVHVVGHTSGELVHRRSDNDGVTWSPPNVIAPAAGNFPGMYGGLFSQGDTLYLITAVADMGSGPRQLDFRRSDDNGSNWTAPVRITDPAQPIFRVRIVASGSYVHVAGAGVPTPQGSLVYFRSTNNGVDWEAGAVLAGNLGEYGGGQTVAVDGAVVHTAYTLVNNGPGGGESFYIRSPDNGESWSQPLLIGEQSMESDRQARVQVVAQDGRVFATWQREAEFTGAPLLPDRLGYNMSDDGGLNWGVAAALPEDSGVERNHPQVWMSPGGAVHLLWRHGNSGSDPAGVVCSSDYGTNWEPRTIAMDTAGANHPFSVVADESAVHVLTGPAGEMQYAYRLLQ